VVVAKAAIITIAIIIAVVKAFGASGRRRIVAATKGLIVA
jgi:hypothetical protein